jgi:hypothetical protein
VHAQIAITFAAEATTIHYGDIGVSPGTSVTSVQVLNLVNGEIKNGNTTFQADVTSAWTTLRASGTTTAGTIELGGQTYTPGIIKATTTLNIAANTFVTLDGEGNEDAEFLFIAGSSLVTGADTYFILKGGAKAENILWVLGTAATFGAQSVIEGSILAGTFVTFGASSTVRGCVLAQSSITMANAGFVSFDGVETQYNIDDGPTVYNDVDGGTCANPIVPATAAPATDAPAQIVRTRGRVGGR